MKLATTTVIPYVDEVHTVIETSAYLAAAKDAGMTAEEQQVVVDLIAAHPKVQRFVSCQQFVYTLVASGLVDAVLCANG